MPRQVQALVENNFTRGLITETTALQFPPNASTDAFDCIFDESGRVTRRLGFDYEVGASTPTVTFTSANEAFSEFTWTNVGGQAQQHFFVQQQGKTLHFYDLSSDTTISTNKKSFTVDLTDHLPTGSAEDPSLIVCQYAVSDGDLIVVNSVCDPFFINYLAETDDIEETDIVLKIRDFSGVDDGLTLNNRPTATVSGLISSNPEHYYNLLNQGWYAADALSQWDAARTDLPSNADIVSLYRASATDSFDNSRVTAQSPGNTPAPKGHFILEVTDVDRPTAITDDGLTGVGTITSTVDIGQGVGAVFGDMTGGGGIGSVFDGITNQSGLASAISPTSIANGYVGKNFSSGSAFRIVSARVHGPNDGGYVNGINPTTVITLYGKTSAPSSGTDGTALGTISFTDTNNESAARTITSSDNVSHWYYVWLYIQSATSPAFVAISEAIFTTVGSTSNPGGLEPFSTTERPGVVAHFNSRLFYGGIDNALIGNNIYFTPIIEFDDQRGYCYQQNDPTAEEVSDLLPSDGGVIRIQDMGSIKRLFSMKEAVIAFANNGVWLIKGSQGSGFRADDYVINRLSNLSTNSPLSFVDYKGIPIWWGDDGIYTIKYNADYNSYEVISLTDDTIKSFFLDIPVANRRFAKGIYSLRDDLIYWLYNDDDTPEGNYVYNKVLVLNPLTKCFYPWTISEPASGPRVRGLYSVQDAETNDPEVVKYTTTVNINASTESLTFSETRATDYEDWDTWGTAVDYSSYFISGYNLSQAAQSFMQSNYVSVFLETEANSSCFMQGVYDFTNSGDSGKWSSKQQVYNSSLTNRDINYRRLKVRGKGRSLQLRFTSEAGKPFNIIGWSVWATANSTP